MACRVSKVLLSPFFPPSSILSSFFYIFSPPFTTSLSRAYGSYPPAVGLAVASAQTAVSAHRRQRSHFRWRFVIRHRPLGSPSIPRASDLSCTDTRFFFFKITLGRPTGLLRRRVVVASPLPYGDFTRIASPSLCPFPSLFQTKLVSVEAFRRWRLHRAPWFALVCFTVKIFFFPPYGTPVR